MDDAGSGQTQDRIPHWYSLGFQALEEWKASASSMARLEVSTKTLQERTEILEITVAQEDAKIRNLAASSEGYLATRHRFLETYRRDILGVNSYQSEAFSQAGNEAAHHGDAVSDSLLYERGLRSDQSLLIRIYGLTPDQILSQSRIGDFDSIHILNAVATLKARQGKEVPTEIEQACNTFVGALERNIGRPAKEDPKSELGRAYHNFWNTYNKHMSS